MKRAPGLAAPSVTIVKVKRVLAWFAGLVGIAALGRWLAGRSKAKPVPATAEPDVVDATAAPEGDPAEELRRKLAVTRAASDPEATGNDEALDDRRARVHAQAQETIDAMSKEGS